MRKTDDMEKCAGCGAPARSKLLDKDGRCSACRPRRFEGVSASAVAGLIFLVIILLCSFPVVFKNCGGLNGLIGG